MSDYYNPEMETLPLDELQVWHDRQVKEIVEYAYHHAPGMRRVMDQAGVTPDMVQGLADLAKIPITRKDELIELQRTDPPFGGFLGIPIEQVKRIYRSPGPLYDPEGPKSDYWRMAQGLYAAGFRRGDIALNPSAYHLTPLGFMLDEALRALGCIILPTGPGNTDTQIEMIRELGVTAYVGVPSYLLTIVERLESQGLNWQKDTRLTKAFVLAEPFPPSLRQALADRGISARECYGTAEAGNLGFACSEADGWHIPCDVIVQIIDINTGEPLGHGKEGEVVVTLLEETYPLIRFGTGDLSALNTTPCPCGRTSPRLVGWLGRVGQAVKVRGMFVHPRQIAQVFSRFDGIKAYQSVITRNEHRDEITIRVAGDFDPDALSGALQDMIKLKANLERVSPDQIPAGAPNFVDERTWE